MKNIARCFLIFSCLFIIVQLIIFSINIGHQYPLSKRIPVNLGLGLGATLTIHFSHLLIMKFRASKGLGLYSIPVIVSYFLLIIALPFSLGAGIVFGGTLGGGLMGALFDGVNLGMKAGIAIGIGVGIFAISFIVTFPVLLFSFALGDKLKNRSLRKFD